jgi:hypothetical protein
MVLKIATSPISTPTKSTVVTTAAQWPSFQLATLVPFGLGSTSVTQTLVDLLIWDVKMRSAVKGSQPREPNWV